jgi:hypothetical protein
MGSLRLVTIVLLLGSPQRSLSRGGASAAMAQSLPTGRCGRTTSGIGCGSRHRGQNPTLCCSVATGLGPQLGRQSVPARKQS